MGKSVLCSASPSFSGICLFTRASRAARVWDESCVKVSDFPPSETPEWTSGRDGEREILRTAMKGLAEDLGIDAFCIASCTARFVSRGFVIAWFGRTSFNRES